MNRVDQAFQHIDRDEFVLREDGRQVTQSTANFAIRKGLEMLDVQEGDHVLEIGTGSGFSGALLSQLVGIRGSVVSVDIEPELTKRARELCKRNNIHNTLFITGDGRNGYDSQKPYDRIIAWTTPPAFPAAWKEQIRENGIIVAPFQVLPMARGTVTVRIRNKNGLLHGEAVSGDGYIMMYSEPVKDINLSGEKIHASLVGDEDHPVWASSEWMEKGVSNQEWTEIFYRSQLETSPFEESGRDIRAYLLGTNPDGFTYAFHPDYGYWVGYSSPDGFALVCDHEPNQWMISDQEHADVLKSWWNDWNDIGCPSYEQLQPFFVGNKVKVKLKGGV
ncbi:protein-L-isoaspartate(D-aspartate) O-methyltransferase [Croceifilum oryzae]|uniref:Protein-L-isoaspartate O-methyltransferase n=2 Tax=Croceifilum oryzae TaxID=1553429 RepID=A0AAJ1WS20_9BACL|nr:protein-L-isoaspartate(D-aspartate) O-methyltransferase [Croceifilum oryzae]